MSKGPVGKVQRFLVVQTNVFEPRFGRSQPTSISSSSRQLYHAPQDPPVNLDAHRCCLRDAEPVDNSEQQLLSLLSNGSYHERDI